MQQLSTLMKRCMDRYNEGKDCGENQSCSESTIKNDGGILKPDEKKKESEFLLIPGIRFLRVS